MSTRTARSHVNADATMPWLAPVPELRREVHPRFRVNWAAVWTVTLLFLVGVVIGSGITFGIMSAHVNPASLPPCLTEDSTGCYWDADTHGNGQGQDVVTP